MGSADLFSMASIAHVQLALHGASSLEVSTLATIVATALVTLALYRLRRGGGQGRLLAIPLHELPVFITRQHELASKRRRHSER